MPILQRAWQSAIRARSFFRPYRIPPWLYWSPTVLFLGSFYVPIQITGQSMQPTLNPDSSLWRDIGLFDRVSVITDRDYQRGDIVTVRSPGNRKRILVKRIAALEGDTVKTLPPYQDSVVRIPPGHVWIEGDEPFHSDDSNLFGPIPAALIESKLIGILWPPNRFGRLPKPDLPVSKNGPAYRQAMAIFEKERSRRARVTQVTKPNL